MMKMGNKVMCIILGIILLPTYSLISQANGGPMGGADLVKGGRVEFINVEDIEISKEILEIKLGVELVTVRVSYVLQNNGSERLLDYAFPVKLFLREYFEETEVYDFNIYDGDKPIDYKHQKGEWSEPIGHQERNDYYISQLSFKAGEVKNLTIEYKVYPEYLDWGTSKSTFPSFSEHLFEYDLLPASHWGNGIIEEFELIIDTTEIFEVKGWVTEASFDEIDTSQSINRITINDLSIEDYPVLSLTYNIDDYKLKNFIERRDRRNHVVRLEASSTLDSEKYSLLNLLDKDKDTCWVEGSPGSGVGEWFEIYFNEPTYIESLMFENGFYINEDLYYKNSRIKKMTVEYETGPDEQKEIKERSFEYEDKPYSLEFFNKFDEARLSVTCTKLKVTINEVYGGNKYEDVCISEILILGWSSKEIEEQPIVVVHNATNVSELKPIQIESKEVPFQQEVVNFTENESASVALNLENFDNTNRLDITATHKDSNNIIQASSANKMYLYVILGVILGALVVLSIRLLRKK